MFDAQSLLGGLLKQATGRRNLGSKAALGMGALGVAIKVSQDTHKLKINTKWK